MNVPFSWSLTADKQKIDLHPKPQIGSKKEDPSFHSYAHPINRGRRSGVRTGPAASLFREHAFPAELFFSRPRSEDPPITRWCFLIDSRSRHFPRFPVSLFFPGCWRDVQANWPALFLRDFMWIHGGPSHKRLLSGEPGGSPRSVDPFAFSICEINCMRFIELW
jgi:hypothetical protein